MSGEALEILNLRRQLEIQNALNQERNELLAQLVNEIREIKEIYKEVEE